MAIKEQRQLLSATQRTAVPASMPTFNTSDARGVLVCIDMQNLHSTSPSLTFTIQDYDWTAKKWRTILASAAVTTVSTVYLRVYPGIAVAANATANDVVGPLCRVLVAGTPATATYGVSATPLP